MGEGKSVVGVEFRAGIAVITIDYPPVNALSKPVRLGLIDAITRVKDDAAVKAIVLRGAGGRFIAGADLREMSLPVDEPSLPTIILAIESCNKPVIAAIEGAALGGGYELTLACDLRIAKAGAIVGLPEVRLGIIPGAGGTQRLPRLTGRAKAMTLITGARAVKAAEALSLGMLDDVVDGDVTEAALARALATPKRRLSALSIPPDKEDDMEAALTAAGKQARKLPAVGEAIRLIKQAGSGNFADEIADERATFLRLRGSDEAVALRHIFFAERAAAKIPGLPEAKPRKIETTAVIGGGTMGSGIAVSLADAGFAVTLLEQDDKAAEGAARRVQDTYDRLARSGRLSADEAARRRGRIAVAADWQRAAGSDLFIEAVFENMDVKKDVFTRLEKIAKPGAVLASNTSYLDLDDMFAGLARRGDGVGLHFFAPANVMKLLEIVRAKETAPDVLATATWLARKLGKVGVVARVGEGFIGNRIYSAYRRHCEYLLEDGAALADIDAAAEAMGFAMGPFAVSDLSGLDIAWATRKRLAPTRDPKQRYVAIADRLCERGRLGRKAGKGWYRYAEGGGRGVPDPEVDDIVKAEQAAKGIKPRAIPAAEIQNRIWAVMANEGAKILEEGIALRPSDIDLVLVNGYGLASTTGGPMFHADRAGLKAILAEMQRAFADGGAGSEPAALLARLAAQGGTFASLNEADAAG
ncbi:MAG: 3-hydroxyacyl-CoA dehydrogenase NAD-binding domain-containing protein [Xanthobacteraceae bacterium]